MQPPQDAASHSEDKQRDLMYLRRLSWPGSNGCCGFFELFGRVLKVVLPNVSPVSVAGSAVL